MYIMYSYGHFKYSLLYVLKILILFSQVLQNCLISKVEIRTEESLDIIPYTHSRTTEKIVVDFDSELKRILDQYLDVSSLL